MSKNNTGLQKYQLSELAKLKRKALVSKGFLVALLAL